MSAVTFSSLDDNRKVKITMCITMCTYRPMLKDWLNVAIHITCRQILTSLLTVYIQAVIYLVSLSFIYVKPSLYKMSSEPSILSDQCPLQLPLQPGPFELGPLN